MVFEFLVNFTSKNTVANTNNATTVYTASFLRMLEVAGVLGQCGSPLVTGTARSSFAFLCRHSATAGTNSRFRLSCQDLARLHFALKRAVGIASAHPAPYRYHRLP